MAVTFVSLVIPLEYKIALSRHFIIIHDDKHQYN